jgi:hypothetical protein
VRKQVIHVCQGILQEPELKPADRYWAMATMAEAHYGLGDKARFEGLLTQASSIAPESWMVDTTRDQVAKLESLLSKSAVSGQ